MQQIGISNIYSGCAFLQIVATLVISGVSWLTLVHDVIHDHENVHKIPHHGEGSPDHPEEEADCTWCFSGFASHAEVTASGYYTPITYLPVGLAEILFINRADHLFPARAPPSICP